MIEIKHRACRGRLPKAKYDKDVILLEVRDERVVILQSCTRQHMNIELQSLFQADRVERVDQPRRGTSEYTAMRERDLQRRIRAGEIVAAGGAITADDYYHAAQLFQHGDTPDDAWQAHTLALRALELGN